VIGGSAAAAIMLATEQYSARMSYHVVPPRTTRSTKTKGTTCPFVVKSCPRQQLLEMTSLVKLRLARERNPRHTNQSRSVSFHANRVCHSPLHSNTKSWIVRDFMRFDR
jgi:hypothetical protein